MSSYQQQDTSADCTTSASQDTHGSWSTIVSAPLEEVVCSGCRQHIRDRFLLQVNDQPWHERCVRCSACGIMLTEKCFARRGRLFCKEDFTRISTSCAADCGRTLGRGEEVTRVRDGLFHAQCCLCCECGKTFKRGDKLSQGADNKLRCQHHATQTASRGQESQNYVTAETEANQRHPSPAVQTGQADGKGTQESYAALGHRIFDDLPDLPEDTSELLLSPLQLPSGDVFLPTLSRDEVILHGCCSPDEDKAAGEDDDAARGDPYTNAASKNKQPDESSDKTLSPEVIETLLRPNSASSGHSASLSLQLDEDSAEAPEVKDDVFPAPRPSARECLDSLQPPSKRKRVPRTTISAEQLATLRAVYEKTPQPTKAVREELVKETGLSGRVVQVWFQNRRSSDRKHHRTTTASTPSDSGDGIHELAAASDVTPADSQSRLSPQSTCTASPPNQEQKPPKKKNKRKRSNPEAASSVVSSTTPNLEFGSVTVSQASSGGGTSAPIITASSPLCTMNGPIVTSIGVTVSSPV